MELPVFSLNFSFYWGISVCGHTFMSTDPFLSEIQGQFSSIDSNINFTNPSVLCNDKNLFNDRSVHRSHRFVRIEGGKSITVRKNIKNWKHFRHLLKRGCELKSLETANTCSRFACADDIDIFTIFFWYFSTLKMDSSVPKRIKKKFISLHSHSSSWWVAIEEK